MATAAATTDTAKRKHIVWNVPNLSYNEANKSVRTLPEDRSPPAVVEARRRSTDRSSATPPPFVVLTPSPPLPSPSQAKMKIDEPDTPWASPPRELFEDPAADADADANAINADADAKPAVALDDVAARLEEIESGGGAAGPGTSPGTSPGKGAGDGGEWESSDDEDATAEKSPKQRPKLSFPDPREAPGGGGGGGGGELGEEEGGGAFDDVDKVLTARLFEAQRKAHQCSFRGVMAQGRSLLEEEEDDE